MNAKRTHWAILSVCLLTISSNAQAGQLLPVTQISRLVVGQTAAATTRKEADELLRRGRQALKEGDVQQAVWYLERAEGLNMSYEGLLQRFGDTPSKLRRDLEKAYPDLARPSSTAVSATGTANGATQPLPLPSKLTAAQLDGQSRLGQPVTATLKSDAPATTQPGVGVTNAGSAAAKKAQALQMLAMAKVAMQRGELARAEQLTAQAHALNIPEASFGPGEMQPWMVALEIERAKRRQQPLAGNVQPAVATPAASAGSAVRQASAEIPLPEDVVESPSGAGLELFPAPAAEDRTLRTQPTGTTGSRSALATTSRGYELLKQGEAAIKAGEFQNARQLFSEAWKYEDELDPSTRQRLQDNLQLNNVRVAEADQPTIEGPAVSAQSTAEARFRAEVSREQVAISRQLAGNPKRAWEALKRLRERVADAEVSDGTRRALLARVDRGIRDAENYIEQNRARIELDDGNREVLSEIDRRRKHRIHIDDELASMVDDFNELMDQQRFSEAVVLAKKVREIDPSNPLVESLVWKSRFAEQLMVEMSLRERSQDGVVSSLTSVVESGIPFDDRLAIEFPNAKSWADLTHRRMELLRENGRQYSETEMEIQRALRKPVQVDFTNQTLSEVLNQLGDLAGISIYLDPQGLAGEGVTTDMPVSIELNREVQLKSALNIILGQFGLNYVIQDEVLKVTSDTIRASETTVVTYPVGDLVIPIPNFAPSYDMGLPSAIREAYNAQGFGSAYQGGYQQVPLTVLANNQSPGTVGGQTLASLAASEMLPATGPSAPQPLGFGPGGLGGAAQADFDTLIDLIQATIAPDSWDDVGGEGSIQSFPTNLSLVVSQTQEVHEQIADLLTQLRRLQDLQVTIEVRFITLNDNFFERIGVDFDFDIDDNAPGIPEDDSGPSVTIGLDPQGNPTADLDVSFTQGSFNDAVPAFGNFNQSTAANFGFAIISDIEAFFLIEAAQGDTRTNILQAPKVTLFNGQQASVNDTSQRPFVTSVTPVVGDFAAAQAPIIVVLSEGTSLTVQAVVSNDRRFVRLTLVPFFSKIGDVEEFTFEGRRTSNTGTIIQDPTDDTQNVVNDAEEFVEGTTVQLPQFAFTSVSTTVSVPDGGTILLGGIKRLSEGRNEKGVPLLSKFPYVNRLFKNVGIGRSTQSLMMMVTPRIIIQEEEEEKLGIATANN